MDIFEVKDKLFTLQKSQIISDVDFEILYDCLCEQNNLIESLKNENNKKDRQIISLANKLDDAKSDLKISHDCETCKHKDGKADYFPCSECFDHSLKYQWRGILD